MMVAVALAAMIQAAPPPPAAVRPDVVVRGQRPGTKAERMREIDRQIDTILPRPGMDQPLGRFQTAVCPGVMGLTRASAQAIADRIGAVADELGLDVGAPGCAPNLLVVVATDADAAARRLAAKRPGVFVAQELADIRRILAEPGSARGWNDSEIRSREGERLRMATIIDPDGEYAPKWEQDVPMLNVRSVGRTALGFRRDILRSFVIIDADAVRGRDTRQIADYAAMRALAGAGPRRVRGAYTILSAFTPDGDATAPPELTVVDWGILRGLYTGLGNRPSGLARGEIMRSILARTDEQRPDRVGNPLAERSAHDARDR